MRRQEDDNNLMVDTLVEDKTDLERKLTVSKAECARVSAEGISLKKEALIKSKKTEATSKVCVLCHRMNRSHVRPGASSKHVQCVCMYRPFQ